MTLSKRDFVKLEEMQRLCTQVEHDLEALREFAKFLKASDKRMRKLASLYEADWLRITESPKLGRNERQKIEALVAKGEYSIFWQDTIWNAVSDSHAEKTRLIELLSRMTRQGVGPAPS